MNGIRGTRTRSGKKHRETVEPRHNQSMTGRIVEAGKYYDCFEVKHDNSLTRQQHLKLFGMRSLLRQGTPFSGKTTVIRETSKTHRRVVEVDE
jgi:hypothetical protein